MLTVQIGQAGNQLGARVFGALEKSGSFQDDETLNSYFRTSSKGRLIARALAIDTEPKVIQQIQQHTKANQWTYLQSNMVCERRGAGNNWAHGYAEYGGSFADLALERMQSELEHCDVTPALHVITSVAGGTGSGLGARMTEQLRDALPSATIINSVVWPYSSGEVIVQNYNALLSLAKIYPASSAVQLLANDDAHAICGSALKLKHITIDNLNTIMSEQLCGSLVRGKTGTFSSPFKGHRTCSWQQWTRHLVPHPDFKLLTLRTLPQMPETYRDFTCYNFDALLKTAREMMMAHAATEEGFARRRVHRRSPSVGLGLEPVRNHNVLLAASVKLHGKPAQANVSTFLDPAMYTEWAPGPLKVTSSSTPYCGHEKAVSIAYNGSMMHQLLDSCVGKAWHMYRSRAYVHQYHRYGVEEQQFEDAFLSAEQIINDYKSL